VSTSPIRKELLMSWFVVLFLVTAGWWVAMVARLRKLAAVKGRRPVPVREVSAVEATSDEIPAADAGADEVPAAGVSRRRTRDPADVAG
jgi:hypothetical protein